MGAINSEIAPNRAWKHEALQHTISDLARQPWLCSGFDPLRAASAHDILVMLSSSSILSSSSSLAWQLEVQASADHVLTGSSACASHTFTIDPRASRGQIGKWPVTPGDAAFSHFFPIGTVFLDERSIEGLWCV
jgi:hypothetical protein